jgi:hypothetical protein
MRLSLPLTLLFGLIVLLMVRKDGLKVTHAVVAILLGFYLSATSLGGGIGRISTMIASMLGGTVTHH